MGDDEAESEAPSPVRNIQSTFQVSVDCVFSHQHFLKHDKYTYIRQVSW